MPSCILFDIKPGFKHEVRTNVLPPVGRLRKHCILWLCPQYSEWTVGPLSSATCIPMFMQFTGCQHSQFSILIGQKMQLTG